MFVTYFLGCGLCIPLLSRCSPRASLSLTLFRRAEVLCCYFFCASSALSANLLLRVEIVKLLLISIRYYQNIGGKYRYFPIKYREKNIADIYRFLKKYRDIEIFFCYAKRRVAYLQGINHHNLPTLQQNKISLNIAF